MSDEQLNQAFSKEELGFLENVAKPEIQPTEEEKKLFDTGGKFDYNYYEDYQHKDGTRVLTRCVSRCNGFRYNDDEYEDWDYITEGEKIRTVVLIKGENYVRFAFEHTMDKVDPEGDSYYDISVKLNISIGKLGEDNSRASLDFIDKTDKVFGGHNPDYWVYDHGSMIDAEIHNILGKENPALRDVFQQYIPEGVDIANALTRHSDATQKQINQAVFMKALDKWKNTK